MDSFTSQRVQELVSKHEAIAIATGTNPNLDSMAATLSLYLGLSKMGKKVSVACPTDPLVEVSSLVGINRVKKQLAGGAADLAVSFPYQEGSIEKVSYTLENGRLNIIVKAGSSGLYFSEKDVTYTQADSAPKLLLIVGTPRLSDLGPLFNADTLKETVIVNIDNKSENQGFGEVVLVSPEFSSVSEQVVRLLQSLAIDIDIDMAQNLLSGIHFATSNFQHPKTSASAFEIAGFLMRKGAIRKKEEKAEGQKGSIDALFTPSPAPSFSQPFRETTSSVAQKHEAVEEKEAPPDWLTPKIYKGSTIV
ncbi:MAG: hypothetical protein A3B53_03200 [Candidatus Levybacteria bacterium RIFCSPLOWO2_01_FULL_42_15]|nr:MAG: hypothetical protein A3B53_03200 [Candidatus Levybacteria bacterium RIFCSPLOWO2_01_FULL_42_15]